jgi:hypothetical protein
MTSFGFATTPGALSWVQLDAMGNETGPRTAFMGYSNVAPIAMSGTDSLVLLGGHSGGVDFATHIDAARIDSSGTVVTAPFAITHDPNDVSRWNIVRVGTSTVAAWMDATPPGRIDFARVAP